MNEVEAVKAAIANTTDFDGDRMASRYADSELHAVALAAIAALDAARGDAEPAMTTPEQIAAGLTKVEARWLPWFTPEPFAGFPASMAKATLQRMMDKGLIDKHRPKSVGMVKWSLTPLGQQVRTILEKNNERG